MLVGIVEEKVANATGASSVTSPLDDMMTQ